MKGAKEQWEMQRECELYEYGEDLKNELFEDRTWRALSELNAKECQSGRKDFKEKTDVCKSKK